MTDLRKTTDGWWVCQGDTLIPLDMGTVKIALEEAAKIADKKAEDTFSYPVAAAARDIAEDIRALIPSSAAPDAS